MRTQPGLRLRAAALLLALGAIAAGARTQAGQPHLHLNDVLEQEPVPGAAGLPALALTLDFTLLDNNNQLAAGVEPESASLRLIGGDEYPASLQKLESPWSIVIVVDASKTLTGFTASAAFKTARFALADSLEQAPGDSNFAVLSFGSQPATVVDFTQDKETVQTALRNRIRALSDQNSCLNQGVYEAVTKLSGASGRRAVFVFTASADGCGQRPAQDVIDLARRNHIQIYGVGLRGYSINDLELGGLTEPTGGTADLREQDSLIFAAQNVMSSLGQQWQARATLYPPAGPQTAQMSVTLADGTILDSEAVPFDSDQSYAQPPAVAVRGQVQSTSGGLSFNLDLTSPDLISQLNVDVVSQATGNPVASQTLTDFGASNQIAVDNLTVGQEYLLVVQALDSRGQALSEASAEFTYEPPQAVLTVLQVQPPSEEQPAFALVVDSLNLEQAVKYKAWLEPASSTEGTAQPVEGTTQVVPVGDALLIPVEPLQTGVYKAVVQALDTNDTVLAQSDSQPFNYTRPSGFEAFVQRFGETRLAIAATTLVCLAVFAVAAVAGGIVIVRRTTQPKQVMLVLPERKIRAPAPISEPRFEPPSPPPERSRLNRPTQLPAESNLNRPTQLPDMTSVGVAGTGVGLSAPSLPPPPRAEPLPKARLCSRSGTDTPVSAEISRAPFSIGRREGNDLTIRVSNKSGLSGRHATVTFSGGRFYIQDEFSSFGTRVNEERLQPGIPRPLDDGAVIALGPSVTIQFVLGENCP
jgi:hypothetical protein